MILLLYLNIFEVYGFSIWFDYLSTMFFFNIFSSIALFFSLLIILLHNPVYSIFCLLFVSIFSGFILFLLNIEFLSIMLILIYVGGISVLFIFSIMLLNLKRFQPKKVYFTYFVGFIEFFFFFQMDSFLRLFVNNFNETTTSFNILYFSDIIIIGSILYTEFLYSFIIIGIILFIAMIGSIAIILTVVYDAYNQKF